MRKTSKKTHISKTGKIYIGGNDWDKALDQHKKNISGLLENELIQSFFDPQFLEEKKKELK
jgi:hypothetical protein